MDPAIAALCFALFSGPRLVEDPAVAIAVLGLLAAAPLAVRRRAPLPVLAAVTGVLAVASLTGVRFTPFVSNCGPVLGVAVYTVAERLPRRASLLAALASALVVTVADGFARYLHPHTDQDAVQLLVAAAGWLIGAAVAVRRGYEQRLRAQEAERAAEAERRIRAEERLRVSADVHDIVSHTLSMIAVRSGVARVVLEQDPAEARTALAAIETASREALDELRAVLRTVNPAAGPDRPGLADVPVLVERLRTEGYPIELTLTPGIGAPPLVEESAYRVVQEALTNVVRHAGPVPTTVHIVRDDHALHVRIVNAAGKATGQRGAGLGLAGMRERVALHDGALEAGPRPEGGFAVDVRLPA